MATRFDRFGPTNKDIAVRSSTGQLYVDYKNIEPLRRLMSPNGKINGRKRTGLTAYEQRLAAQAIKRARYMGLLPFTSATL
ncbi:MAG: 30S ribosomal protein S18 [Planctomycetes bacterium]|nr:30S ribosomal protein S18 [Planctomycetota bacterium]